MNWQHVKAEFEYDGSLRDLYILETDMETWQRLLEFLRVSSYPLTYAVDSNEAGLPANVAYIFRKRQETGVWLKIDVKGIQVLCHFFTEEEIEFDVDSREIDSETRFNHLCDFMRELGQHLSRSVIMTPESNEKMVIIRYLPIDDRFVYSPAGIYH